MRFSKKNTKLNNDNDDNLVVANMNIEGMPWYSSSKPIYEETEGDMPLPELSKKELRRITLSATLAGLLVGSVFLIIFFLFIMFCVHIWF